MKTTLPGDLDLCFNGYFPEDRDKLQYLKTKNDTNPDNICIDMIETVIIKQLCRWNRPERQK